MPAVKRSGSPVKGEAKVAKVEPEIGSGSIENVVKAIEEMTGLPEDVRTMLRTAAPLCLNRPKEERHMAQTAVIDTMAVLFANESEARDAVVKQCKEKIEALDAVKVANAHDIQSSIDQGKKDAGVADEKKAAALQATAEVDTAKAAVNCRKEDEDAVLAERQVFIDQKTEQEKVVSDMWDPLKACSFETTKWQARNKTIEALMTILKKLGIEESLSLALPVAFKAKTLEERSKYAGIAIKEGERKLTEHISSLVSKIEGFQPAVTEKAGAKSEAEAVLLKREEEAAKGAEESKAAEEVWEQESERQVAFEQQRRNLNEQAEQLKKSLDVAQDAWGSFGKLVQEFEIIRQTTNGTEAGA